MARKGATRNKHAKNCETSCSKPRDDSPSVVRFFKIMFAKNYWKVLYLPPLFAESVKHLAGQETEIEDVDGNRWPVEYSYVDGSLAFEKGWARFYNDHGLQIGHFVVFNYVNESHFVVQIYDESAMEITHFNSVGPQSNKRPKRNSEIICTDEQPPQSADSVASQSMGMDNPSQNVTSFDDPILMIDTRNNGKSLIVATRDGYKFLPVVKASGIEPLSVVGRNNKSAARDYALRPRSAKLSVVELKAEHDLPSGKLILPAVVKAEHDLPYDHTVSLSAKSPFSAKVENQLYLELPIHIPAAGRRKESRMGEGKVMFLRGPNGRLIPVLYPGLYKDKTLTGNWNLFCEMNGVNPGDESRFEVEDEKISIYRVDITRSNGISYY